MKNRDKGQGFYDIRDALMSLIYDRRQSGILEMPSENSLADYFGVSRSLIRSVYQQLVELGYLESRQGKGYFVSQSLPTVNLLLRGDQSFSQKMAAQGYQCVSQQLPLQTDEEAVYFSRLRVIEGVPMAIHRSRILKDLFPQFIEEIGDSASLYAYFKQKGLKRIDSSYGRLSTQIPDQEMSRLLCCPSLTSLLVLESNTIDLSTNQELETSQIFYRADIVNFTIK